MKSYTLILLFISSFTNIIGQQNVGIGTTMPNSSSILDITSTTKGMLVPRMLAAERSIIVSPATGLIVFQTDSPAGLYMNTGTPSTPFWEHISTSATSWRLAGNSGTTSGTSFIGTTDDEPLMFKVNGVKAGYLDAGSPYNTSFGYQSLNSNTGNFNSAFGGQALYSNITGGLNTANGRSALFSNSTGNNNTASGYNALYFNSTGNNNTANGYRALYSNTTGFSNIAIGARALYSNTTRSNLVAVGDSALFNNGLGVTQFFHAVHNTAIGSKALFSNTIGSNNTATGWQALYANTTGSDNTAHGIRALYYNTTGFSNSAFGAQALYYNSTGERNTAIGNEALLLNNEGIQNCGIGYHSLHNNTIGSYNTSVGAYALKLNSEGFYNTAIGTEALQNNAGDSNTACGMNALFDNLAGSNNAALGYNALYNNYSGSDNTAFGLNALYANASGNYNTGVGRSAYFDNTALSNTSCFGYDAGGIVEASNRIEIGNTSVTWIGGEVAWSQYSDARIKENVSEDVPGLSFISLLRPVTYNLNIHRQNEMVHTGEKLESEWPEKYDIERIKMTGFIAQEVEQAAKQAGYNFSGVEIPKDPKDLYSLRYSDFVMPLVKAVQELSEINTTQEAINQKLTSVNENLLARIERLEALLDLRNE